VGYKYKEKQVFMALPTRKREREKENSNEFAQFPSKLSSSHFQLNFKSTNICFLVQGYKLWGLVQVFPNGSSCGNLTGELVVP
jgi:hypothetical protein